MPMTPGGKTKRWTDPVWKWGGQLSIDWDLPLWPLTEPEQLHLLGEISWELSQP